MPFYSHRYWYQPIVMGISYVNRYIFNGHIFSLNIYHALHRFVRKVISISLFKKEQLKVK